MATPTSLVALGRANTGAAVVLEGGNRPLDILMRQDALNQRRQERARQAAQREQDAALKEFATSAKLNTKGFLPFQKRLDAVGQEKYDTMLSTAQNRNLDRATKLNTYRKEAADMEGLTNLTNEIEQKTKQTIALGQDKRFKKGAVEKAAFETFYNPDTCEALDPREYDPSVLDTLADKPDLYDVNAVVTQFVKDTFQADSVARSSAARLGGTGMSQQATSNLFELNEDGSVKIDPVTRKEVMKVTDDALRTANSDPFMKNILDAKMRQREASVQNIEQKMAAFQPLTEEERQFLNTEANKTGIDDLEQFRGWCTFFVCFRMQGDASLFSRFTRKDCGRLPAAGTAPTRRSFPVWGELIVCGQALAPPAHERHRSGQALERGATPVPGRGRPGPPAGPGGPAA